MSPVTLRNLGDLIIYAGAVAAAIAAIAIIVRYVAVRPLKTWITEQTRPSRRVLEQLQPNGGLQDSTRHLIEQTAQDVAAMNTRLDELTKVGSENRELANAALTLARETSQRLDRHLSTGHTKE